MNEMYLEKDLLQGKNIRHNYIFAKIRALDYCKEKYNFWLHRYNVVETNTNRLPAGAEFVASVPYGVRGKEFGRFESYYYNRKAYLIGLDTSGLCPVVKK